ncbi:MAG: hypothetical protein LLG02_10130 [Pelosinus sp.]|nr:hypothetical protein [Pelosinus sp.]
MQKLNWVKPKVQELDLKMTEGAFHKADDHATDLLSPGAYGTPYSCGTNSCS